MNLKAPKTKLWRISDLNDLELLRAENITQSFPKHTHERYAVGVLERGALGFFYRGENVVAAAGDVNLCVPGEVHTGQPAVPEGWSYRMFYLGAEVLRQVATEVAAKPRELPFFQSGVIHDDALARQLYGVHCRLETSASRLEQETLLLDVLAQLVSRHADDPPPVTATGREPRVVKLVKRYLEHHYAEAVSLEDLAQLTQLSRYHLVRVFCKTVGVPPHAYLRQVRTKRAKELLASGQTPAEVALATGFTDQSHLTRWFKRLWGYTPGQYQGSSRDSNTVQDSSGLN